MAKVSWGTSAGVTFNTDAISVKMESQAQSRPWVVGDLSGGLTPLSVVHNLDPQSAIYGGNKQWYNQGVMCLPGGITSRAYKSTAQTTLAAVDVSAYRAAGKRVHSVMWPTSTGGRLIVCIGPNLYKTTSVSNPALVAPATADNITDNVTAMWIGYAAGSLALFIGTDSTTDDIKYTTDPTADSISWTSAVTYAHANDRCWWGAYLPTLGVNVFGGTINNVPGIYFFKGSDTLPKTSATLRYVVDTAGKDVPNSNNTTLSLTQFPATAYDVVTDTVVQAGWDTTWVTPGNVTANDGSYATLGGANATSGSVGAWLVSIFGPNFTALPDNAEIVGITYNIEASESNADDNLNDMFIFLCYGSGINDADLTSYTLTLVGQNKADTGTEYATTDTVYAHGSSSDDWAANLSAPLIKRTDFGVAFAPGNFSGGGTTSTINVDYTELIVSYKESGTQAGGGVNSYLYGTTSGSWSPGLDPTNPLRIAVVAPESNDGSAVTVPRKLVVLTFAYDANGDRPTVSTSESHTDLAYVEDAFYHMGGVRVAGGSTSGAAKEAVQLDLDSGDAFPLGFPQVHGTTAVRIVGGYSLGTAAMYWVCNSASTDAQLWMEYDAGKWLPYGAIFSNTLGGNMSTQPLALAERTPDTQQEQLYCFYPSSTNTAVIRQFVPHDPFIDPQLITGNTFQDGPLYLIMPEIAFAPMENRNSITGLNLQSHQVDNNDAYGSVIIAGDTGGDLTVASAEISETFDAAAEAFTDRAVPSSGGSNSPGVTAQTIVWKLTLNGAASSSKTSNALPFVAYTHSQDQLLPVFEMAVTDAPEAPASFVAHLATLQTTKSVQRLVGGGFDVPAVLEPWDATWAATQGLERVGWGDIRKPLVLRFRQVHGSIAV